MARKELLFILFLIPLFMITCTETAFDFPAPILLSPEDGETVTSNPPTFIWQTVEYSGDCDMVYRLEIATDNEFSSGSIVLSTMIQPPETTLTPEGSLSSGNYYWHMCTRENA